MFKKLKKLGVSKLIGALFVLGLLVATPVLAQNIVTSSGVWYRSGNSMLLNPATLHVGSSAVPIAKVWATDLDVAGVFTFGGTMAGDLDMAGNDILNIDRLTGDSAPIEVVGLVYQTGLGDSTYFGENAGAVDDLTANNNVGIGVSALSANTSGANNVAIGHSALSSNIASGVNMAIGSGALKNHTTGGFNTAIGGNAMETDTGGIGNTAQGALSLYLNTDGENNAALGYRALLYNSTGDDNSALGINAGAFITGGSVGNETAGTSLYLGAETKAFAASGANEIVIGYDTTGAGSNTVTLGNDSVALTVLKGLVYQTGLGHSTYFGEGAGASDDLTDNYNVGIGETALGSATTGASNVAIGFESLYSNLTGNSNLALGYQALYASTGHGNTAIGSSALKGNTSGAGSTAIGFNAGTFITDGVTENDSGGSSVYIGVKSKALASGGTNEIVIGHDAIGHGSNTVTLGNALITATYLKGDVRFEAGIYEAVTTVNVATYDLLTGDRILHVTYPTTGAVTSLTLPTAQCDGSEDDGRIITIKDSSGNAGTNNITIDTEGSETIDGAATLSISTNYASYNLYCENSDWYIF